MAPSLSLLPSDHPYIPPLCRSFSRFDSSTPALVFTGSVPVPVPPTFVLVRCRNRASEPSKQASRSRIPAEGGGRRKEGGRSIGSAGAAAAAKDRADETTRGNSSSSSLFNLAAVCSSVHSVAHSLTHQHLRFESKRTLATDRGDVKL
jgi:hypothetical protein